MTKIVKKQIGAAPDTVINSAPLMRTPAGAKFAFFDVAAWLFLPRMKQHPVALVARYKDASKTQEVLIDYGLVDEHDKILLSGIAGLHIHQAVEKLEIHLCSLEKTDNLQIEKLHLQAAEISADLLHSHPACAGFS